jgi:hypothetical protein
VVVSSIQTISETVGHNRLCEQWQQCRQSLLIVCRWIDFSGWR